MLHYNHKLRGAESDTDEDFLDCIARVLDLKLEVKKSSYNHYKSDENTLREHRLAFWQNLNQKEGIRTIIQGHQLDDVAETLLWRFPRGVSVDGLISPKPISQVNEITFLRPFISVSKDFIRKALQNSKIPWREDSTNQKNNYLRNKMRNFVVPAWKNSCDRNLLQGVSSSRDRLEKDCEALNFHALESLERCKSGRDLKIGTLKQLPFATQKRVLQNWIDQNLKGKSAILSVTSKLWELVELLQKDDFSALQITESCFIRRRQEFLRLEIVGSFSFLPLISLTKNSSIFLPNGSRISCSMVEADDPLRNQISNKEINPETETLLALSSTSSKFFVRSRIAGDRFKPMGAPGNKKVSDWMIDRKWTEAQKSETPLFINQKNEIVWIPGFPPAEIYKVTSVDKWVIRLTYWHSDT